MKRRRDGCQRCQDDFAFLQTDRRPPRRRGGQSPFRCVDLFSGAGGLSLGVGEACRRARVPFEVALASEVDADAAAVFARNLLTSSLEPSRVQDLFDGCLGTAITSTESRTRDAVGRVDALVGGPPCQGYSNLNNRTRRNDPRNALYLRMVRAAEVLQPSMVVIENVPAILHDSGGIVDLASSALEEIGYSVATSVVPLSLLGVPQRRYRHILLALGRSSADPECILRSIAPRCPCVASSPRTVWWAIHDLRAAQGRSAFDTASRVSADNQRRVDWLYAAGRHRYDLPNRLRPVCHQRADHTYKSMYGRLQWDEPAQTITTGFGSMGQGRYLHPERPRTLTPHEAARLQGFPDWFRFDCIAKRTAWSRMIGNAVPPFLTLAIAEAVLRGSAGEGPCLE